MDLSDLLGLLPWLANPLVVGLLVGAFVGWNVPQPAYAKYLQDKVVMLFARLVASVKK